MPLDFVKMHKSKGDESRLITLYKNTVNFEEDICLDFKLPAGKGAKIWRDSKVSSGSPKLKFNQPKNLAEKIFFQLRDEVNKPVINNIINEFDLFSYDIYHFDGGMDFFRDLRFSRELKKRGKKIVCCYYGSDLRTRGIFKELDEMSDLNLTVEYDHLSLHKNINYIFFPFDISGYDIKKKNNKKIKIIHSPTNRKFKGTDKILNVINELDKQRQIDFILIENMDRTKVLEIKSGCDLAIDQVGGEMGGTGYGKNSIENLSMGVPTFTEFTEDYLGFIKENPFIHSTIKTLEENIIRLIDNEILRNEISISGRIWVEKYHSFDPVNKMLQEYYKKNSIT
jgi:glycosyltransferase involved in cell wall biosynthesis